MLNFFRAPTLPTLSWDDKKRSEKVSSVISKHPCWNFGFRKVRVKQFHCNKHQVQTQTTSFHITTTSFRVVCLSSGSREPFTTQNSKCQTRSVEGLKKQVSCAYQATTTKYHMPRNKATKPTMHNQPTNTQKKPTSALRVFDPTPSIKKQQDQHAEPLHASLR